MICAIQTLVRTIGTVIASVLLLGLIVAQQTQSKEENKPKEIWLGDVFTNDRSLSYNGYVLEKRKRKIRHNYPGNAEAPSSWIDVSYAVLKRKSKPLMKFDGISYVGMGNDTHFGLASILGGRAKQAVISQDVPRAGVQWIVTLSQHPRLIFDGPRWSVGRESDDMGITDLDGDGVYEITVPITDFYELQDKMSINKIPLPEIVFRYDRRRRRFLPANPRFENYLLGHSSLIESRLKSDDPFEQRSAVLEKLLTYIYIGRENAAWNFYNRGYQLDDKEEIRRRVKTILRKEPVYKFIYNRTRIRR